MDDIDAVAVTYAPGLLGSLLVGIEFAKTIALVYKKPLIKVHHIAGHIYANNLVKKMQFPLLALVISGGHTELVLMEDDHKFKVLGKTLDDAIGEVYDKVARVLDLPYPGGPNIEKSAKLGANTYDLPEPMKGDDLNFSYSGLKSAVINLSHNEKQRGNEIRKYDLACSFQTVAIKQLTHKTELAIQRTNCKRLIIAGGVTANEYLRNEFQKLADKSSAVRGLLSSIYCKPKEFVWMVTQIEVLNPIRYMSFRRNEVKSTVSVKSDPEKSILYTDDDRTQRQTQVLKDVRYRITARICPRPEFEGSVEQLYRQAMRRIRGGKTFMQPSLGLREFVCYFEESDGSRAPIDESMDLGLVVYDVFDLHDYSVRKKAEPKLSLYHAVMEHGVIKVPDYDSDAAYAEGPV